MGLDFLILYEHIVREFDCDALLMAELRRRGYTVELAQLMQPKKLKYFFWKKPKVIVPSAMYDNETLNSFVYNNVGKLDKVVNLHWEEVLSREQEESAFYSLTQNAAKCTHICWGEAAKERITRTVPENNAVITGAMQLDFLLPKFNGYFLSREQLAEEFHLDPAKRWLCYVSSFSAAWMDDKEIAELDAMTSLNFDGFRVVGLRSMTKTLEWFDRYLSEHPDEILIYRPHPSEWRSPPLGEMEKKHANFRVISDYSVKQWVKACDMIMTWMSTSIAEIYFGGKGAIVIRPEPLYDDYDPVFYEGVDAVDSYGRLAEALSKTDAPFPVSEELLRKHYDFREDAPAYVRVADLLEQTLKNEPRDHPFSEGYKPHFNLLKFVSLIGLNWMFTLKIDPQWFKFLPASFRDMTERMMGYIKKGRLPKGALEAKIAELEQYL